LKQAKNFKYLRFEFSYENEKNHTEQKVAKFSKTAGIVNNTFKPTVVQKSSTIKLYSSLALHILLHRHEIWTFRKKDKKGLTKLEMKFLRRTAGYTIFDHKEVNKFWNS
jgi:hypothetical protein